MRLAAVHAGDVVAIRGRGEPRLGEMRAKDRGRLPVTTWPSWRTRDRGPVIVSAREVLAHYRRRARASTAGVGDLVRVDIRGRRFHACVTARLERGELHVDPLTSHISYLHARPRDPQRRWAADGSAMAEHDTEGRRDG